MKDIRFSKAVVLINSSVPAVLLAYDALNHNLGANPVNFAIRTTGMLALIFLTLSLLVSPAARLTGWNGIVHFRRMLGLYAFFHAGAHFLIYFTFDRALSIRSTLTEMAVRPYLVIGSLGLILMLPLAVTSTDRMIRRIGPKRWKLLHRLAYPAAIAGVVHYYMLVKADIRQPVAFAAAIGVLLLYRLIAQEIKLRKAYRSLKAAPITVPKPATKPKFWTGQLKVASIFAETPRVRTLRLAPLTGDELPFNYLPGQYLNVSLMIDGRKVNRSYTIASSPSRKGYCEVTIKREEMGTVSRHVHDQIHSGDLLQVSAPAGKFTFTGSESEGVVLIGAGVGVTPLMSKIRYLTDTSWPGDIFLIYAVRTIQDIIFHDELMLLSKRHPNLHITLTLTQPSADWTGASGRIDARLLASAVPDIASRRVHFCGPDEMTKPLTQLLIDLGVAPDHIQFESFISPAQKAKAEPLELSLSDTKISGEEMAAKALTVPTDALQPDEQSQITFARSGKVAQSNPTQTVLEAAESLGITIEYDCRSGICGQCKIKSLAGVVTMEVTDALTPQEIADGLILSCQARCRGQLTVDA